MTNNAYWMKSTDGKPMLVHVHGEVVRDTHSNVWVRVNKGKDRSPYCFRVKAKDLVYTVVA
jgi:hypothetical protein